MGKKNNNTLLVLGALGIGAYLLYRNEQPAAPVVNAPLQPLPITVNAVRTANSAAATAANPSTGTVESISTRPQIVVPTVVKAPAAAAPVVPRSANDEGIIKWFTGHQAN